MFRSAEWTEDVSGERYKIIINLDQTCLSPLLEAGGGGKDLKTLLESSIICNNSHLWSALGLVSWTHHLGDDVNGNRKHYC